MHHKKEIEKRVLKIEKTINLLSNQLNQYSECVTNAIKDSDFNKEEMSNNDIINRVDEKLKELSNLINYN